MAVVKDVELRGDRLSPILRERKKVVQMPKEIREKVSAINLEEEEKRTPRYRR